jgi:methionyl-tRNA formyltransferase
MKIIFAGTPEFAVPSLQMLLDSEHEVCAVYTQPDRPSGRGRHMLPGAVKQLALAENIPVFQPLTLKTAEELDVMKSLNADLMIVVAYGMILPQAVLDIPRFGCINVHGSLLPRWRGAAPIQRAIMAGDQTTGVTIMHIALKLDAGDMLHKEEILIANTDTASDLHDKLSKLGAMALGKVLLQQKNASLNPQKQDESLVTYAEKLDKNEAVIDWSLSAREIALKVRGLNSWPVAQTLYQNKVLRIWQAQALDADSTLAAGVVSATEKKFDVVTGQGVLRVLEVQLPGGKRMSSEAFLAAHSVNGVKLG